MVTTFFKAQNPEAMCWWNGRLTTLSMSATRQG
jgi:hypothetical protein